MIDRLSIERLRADPAVAESPRMRRQLALAARLRSSARGLVRIDAGASADSIPHRFRQTAHRFASKVAVRTHRWTLTYADLDALSDRVMWRVLASTGGRNVPVALLCGRDAFAIAGILGVLKAGAAYVALDPSFPARRNRLVVDDCGAALLLADDIHRADAVELAGGAVEVDVIDVDMPEQAGPAPQPAPDSIAAIVYTSGSTGTPKGVLHSHRTLLETVRRYANALALGSGDRQLLLSSLSVTASIGNLFSALLGGATLLPFNLDEHGFAGMSSWMQAERVTVYHSVASVFRHWCRENAGRERFPDLRVVRLGGDLAYQSDFELFRASFPEAVLVNGYGCSEMSSVWHYYLDADSVLGETVMPVGYPSEGLEAFLDDGGEIVLVSEHLALGYWGRDELTARSFSRLGPGRLRSYRTGDLGTLLPDGCLLHAGRADSQVKLNGFRVETAEVESALRSCPFVEDAAVVVEAPAAPDRRLLAFVVLGGAGHGGVDALERHVRERLPAHMCPASIVAVDHLPWTPNGKLDRAALASWAKPHEPTAAPGEAVEAAIHHIWCEVLECDGFGIDDSFFRVGGTSLHAFRVISEIERLYGVRPPLKGWFERPTVRELAALVRAARPSPHFAGRGELDLDGASPLEASLWMFQQMNPASCAYNMTRALRIRGALRADGLAEAMNRVIERHDALRSLFEDADGRIIRRVQPSMPLVLAEADARGGAGELDRLITAQARAPFDLGHGPLVRAALITIGADECILIVTVHHIVCDAWSFDLFFRDLFHLYAGRALREAAPQSAELRHGSAEQQDYWRAQLHGAPLDLPIVPDYAPSIDGTPAGARHRFRWSDGVTENIRRLAREEAATPFAVVLAAFAALLSKYGARGEVVIGSAAAGRTMPRSDEAIGLFARVLPIRIRIPAAAAFRALLREVHATLRDGLANQDGAPEHGPAVVCVHRSSPIRYDVPPELDVEPIEIDSGSAKYDLTLIVAESDGSLHPALEYKTDLFDAGTIEALAQAFVILIGNLVAHPDQPLWAASATPASPPSLSASLA
jgi:amino acid adenylation domain-containing protein